MVYGRAGVIDVQELIAQLIVFKIGLDNIKEDRLECRCIIEYYILLTLENLNREFLMNFNKLR